MTSDALTLDEVLEQMLPQCNDSPFEVARWLNDRVEAGKVRLLCDGIVVPPKLYPTHLVAVGWIAPDGRPALQMTLRRSFGLDDKPIEQWTMERKSFEASRPNAPRNRGGRPREVDRERLLTTALIYAAVCGWPDTLDGEGGLFEKLEFELEQVPGRTTLYQIFNPIHDRIEDERNKSKKSKKKPVR